ncbi:hypothetical protein [Rhizobium nepotum]|uniref:Uncharacterized protein n=1 Tax=Rhizobium nepotum 39/7 TaxID=1368418 RepID=A0ABR5CWT7_9HYPH|nr:hypothetical protein [Rhizobium nepotum]KJF69052.1 hypothetical protein RS75_03505 [Rhizobium nepotum 39/7]
MSRLPYGSTLSSVMLTTSLCLFSGIANAQGVEPAPPVAPQQITPAQSVTPGSPVKAADETAAAFLARVNAANPETVSLAAAELFKQSPTQTTIKDLIVLASNTDAAAADMTGRVTSGFPIIAVSTSAAQFSEQVSALVLSDSSQLSMIVALAQKVANKDFSEVVGEGLALAYSTAMQRGDSILAAAIQLQTKGTGVPSDLLIAFSENIEGTAAGPAAPAAAAASPIGGAGSTPVSGNSIGGSATTGGPGGTVQAGGGAAPVGGGGSGSGTSSTGTQGVSPSVAVSTGSTSTPTSTSPV